MEWNRIAKEYLYEASVNDKSGAQVTLLQSWKRIVAIVVHSTKTLVKTTRHYSYNITMALDKLAKQQRLKLVALGEEDFYSLLTDKFGEGMFFKGIEGDISLSVTYDDEEGGYEENDDLE